MALFDKRKYISLSPIYFIFPVTIKSETGSNSYSAILTDPGDPDPGDVQLFWVLVLLTTGGMEMLTYQLYEIVVWTESCKIRMLRHITISEIKFCN